MAKPFENHRYQDPISKKFYDEFDKVNASNWLTDNVVNKVIDEINSSMPYAGKYYIFQPLVVQLLKFRPFLEIASIVPNESKTADFIFLPINNNVDFVDKYDDKDGFGNSTHWILAVLDRLNGIYHIYDSLCQNFDGSQKVNGLDLVQVALSLDSNIYNGITIKSESCPEQRNQRDCALFMLQNIKEIICRSSAKNLSDWNLLYSKNVIAEARRNLINWSITLVSTRCV